MEDVFQARFAQVASAVQTPHGLFGSACKASGIECALRRQNHLQFPSMAQIFNLLFSSFPSDQQRSILQRPEQGRGIPWGGLTEASRRLGSKYNHRLAK